MKRLLVVALVAVALASSAGCSGGSSGPGTAPAIFNLVFFPREFPLGAGGGAVSVTLLFNFSDPDADVVRCQVTGPEGAVDSPLLTPAEGMGVAAVPIIVPTAAAGVRAYTLVAVDAEGNSSNTLSFTVTIR